MGDSIEDLGMMTGLFLFQ